MTASETTDFLSARREEFDAWKSADDIDRAFAEKCNSFTYADDTGLGQWDEASKAARVNRPILQWNRLPTYTHQVINAGRQSKPAIKISALDDTPQETAEYFAGRIRHIEYESSADIAKDCARGQQVVSGRGFMRIKLEWIPGTQQQRIRIEPIQNQFSVVWDNSACQYTLEDADGFYVVSHISKAAYIRDYGQEAYDRRMDFSGTDDPAANWRNCGASGELIQIAECIRREYQTVTIPDEGAQPERTEKVGTWKSYIIDGIQILEPVAELVGSTSQIIPMWGDQAVVDKIMRSYGLVKDAITPQRNANLAISNLSEQVGQMPKSPYLVPVGGIAANHEGDWENALNTSLHALYYQAFDSQNRPLPRPERITAEPPIQACLEFLNSSFLAMEKAMGIFDPTLGQNKSDQSGIAINKLNVQAGIGNFHFQDNESRTNKFLGEILVELIRKTDQPGKSYPIRTADGKTHMVPVGQLHTDYKTRKPVIHDLQAANVGVVVSTGPTYDTAKQESSERDAQLIQSDPELMFAIGPQMLREEDKPGSEERARGVEILRSMKYPNWPQQPDDGQGQQIPPQVQQQIQGLQQEVQKAHQFAQSLHEQIQTKQPELQQKQAAAQMDDATKRYICDQQEMTKREIALMQVNAAAANLKLEQQLGIISDKLDRFHELNQQAAEHAHQVNQAKAAQQAAAQGQQAQQQAAADSQDNAQQFQAQQAQAAQQPQGE